MNRNEFEACFVALPALSQKAIAVIVNHLYAEPGFSDYDTKDLARDLGIDRASVAGVMKRLGEDNLCFAEDYDVNENCYHMIYSDTLHNDENEESGDWDAIRALCAEFTA